MQYVRASAGRYMGFGFKPMQKKAYCALIIIYTKYDSMNVLAFLNWIHMRAGENSTIFFSFHFSFLFPWYFLVFAKHLLQGFFISLQQPTEKKPTYIDVWMYMAATDKSFFHWQTQKIVSILILSILILSIGKKAMEKKQQGQCRKYSRRKNLL